MPSFKIHDSAAPIRRRLQTLESISSSLQLCSHKLCSLDLEMHEPSSRVERAQLAQARREIQASMSTVRSLRDQLQNAAASPT